MSEAAEAAEAHTFELKLHLPERPLLPKDAGARGLPAAPSPLSVAVTPHETLNDLRATIHESPEGYWLGSFCFRRADGTQLGEWDPLELLFDGVPEGQRELLVAHVPYNAAEARAHVQRVHELLTGAPADAGALGVDAGASVQDAVLHPAACAHEAAEAPGEPPAETPPLQRGWAGWRPARTSDLLPRAAATPRTLPRCVRSLALSAWNPPPRWLALQGHMLYLRVETLEGATLHITGGAHGFYVNRSSDTRFDPAPRAGREALRATSLFDVLCAASPRFLEGLARLFKSPLAERNYCAVAPVLGDQLAHPWLARVPAHEADVLRTQTAYLLTGATSPDTLDSARDWNEELQSARELPHATLAERLMRARVLNRLCAEFALAAARAVPRVAAGEVPAINPMDPAASHMYLFNNLFLSRGSDGAELYPQLGGDEAARVAVRKDVQGISLLNTLSPERLCMLGTVVVDWMGERWVAQSVVPGLFRQPEAADAAAEDEDPADATEMRIVYGGLEGTDRIRDDAHFHAQLAPVARRLHLAEHSVRDTSGGEHKLHLSVESKGVRGADGRHYLLDMMRLCPVDVEWLERDVEGAVLGGPADGETAAYPHRVALLRPELVQLYWEHRYREYFNEQLAALPEDERDASRVDPSGFEFAFNPDAFVDTRGADGTVTRVAADESEPGVAAVRAASRWVRDAAVPHLLSYVAAVLLSVADGRALTQQMHARGINMRYLGLVAHLSHTAHADRLDPVVRSKLGPGYGALLDAFRRVAVQEMVVRAAKHRLRALLRTVEPTDAAACVAHFLSSVHGMRGAVEEPVAPASTGADAAWRALTPGALAADLARDVRMRFRYALPPLYFETEMRWPQVLRALCLCMGVQLRIRDYRDVEPSAAPPAITEAPKKTQRGKRGKQANGPGSANGANGANGADAGGNSAEAPAKPAVAPEDVLALVPKLCDSTPRSALVEDAFEIARMAIARGDRELGVELLVEGVGFHEQVYGLVHHITARCYAEFAAIAHHHALDHARSVAVHRARAKAEGGSEDAALPEELQQSAVFAETMTLENALRYQRGAVTIAERTLGLDHPDTMVQYMKLAAVERSAGNTDAALRCLERVLTLWSLLYGEDHPDAVHALSSVALMLQGRREFESSLHVYETAHALALRLFGPDSIYTGNMAHELSQAYTLTGDLRTAIEVEKHAWRIFSERLGAEDALTRESHSFLSSLASSAVRVARMEKDARANYARSGPLQASMPTRRDAGPAGVTSGHAHASAAPAPPARDMSLAERPIDELVQYVQGTDGGKAKRSSRRHHRRH